jgi:hypothetical protein
MQQIAGEKCGPAVTLRTVRPFLFVALAAACLVLLILSASDRLLWDAVVRPYETRVSPLRGLSWDRPSEGTAEPVYRYSRWDGEVRLDRDRLLVGTMSDDGVRVRIDGRLLIDNWTVHAPTLDKSTVYLRAGAHRVRVEHFNDHGPGELSLFFLTSEGRRVHPGGRQFRHRGAGDWEEGGLKGRVYAFDAPARVGTVVRWMRVGAVAFGVAAVALMVLPALRNLRAPGERWPATRLDPWLVSGDSPLCPTLRQRVGAYSAFALATIVGTWPLAAHLGSKIARDLGDPLLNAWVIAWNQKCFLTLSPRIFSPNIFHPLPHASAFTDYQWTTALLALPLRLISANPLLLYNVCVLLALLLTAVALFELAFWLTRDAPSSVAAAFLVSFTPYRFAQLSHVQVVSSHFVPCVLLALHLLAARRGARRFAGLFAGALVAQYLTGFYHSVFLSFHLPVFAVGLLLLHRKSIPVGRAARNLLVAAALAAVVLLPFILNSLAILPHLPAGLERHTTQLLPSVGTMLSSVHPTSKVWGHFLSTEQIGPVCLFPGVTIVVLAILGFTSRRFGLRAAYALLAVLPLMLADGRVFRIASRVYAPFQLIRAPGRQAMLAYIALGIAAAYGIRMLGERVGRRGAWAVAATVCLLAMLEGWSVPLPLNEGEATESTWPGHHLATGRRAPGVYRWLSNADWVTAVAEVPDRPRERYIYQLYSIYHWKPTVGGVSGFTPPLAVVVRDVLQSFPSRPCLRALASLGVDCVVVHYGIMGTDAASIWEKAGSVRDMLHAEYTEGTEVVYRLRPDTTYAGLFRDLRTVSLPAPAVVPSDSLLAELADGDLATVWTVPVRLTMPSRLEFSLPQPLDLRGIEISFGPYYVERPRRALVRHRRSVEPWQLAEGQEEDVTPWLPSMLEGYDRGRAYLFFEPATVRAVLLDVPRWSGERPMRIAEVRAVTGG